MLTTETSLPESLESMYMAFKKKRTCVIAHLYTFRNHITKLSLKGAPCQDLLEGQAYP